MEKIKPCPFCGGPAGIREDQDYDDDFGLPKPTAFYVECKKCDAQSGFFTERNYAVKAWNRRVSDAEPVRHGHWELYGMDIAEHPYHCSVCGWCNHHISHRHIEEFKYCPECGAKMNVVEK